MKYDQLIAQRFDVKSTSGDERVCSCPFHQDGGKPNLYVNARTSLYFCHACNAKGHVGKTTQATDLEELKSRLHRRKSTDAVARPWDEAMLNRFDVPHPFWEDDRGFDAATIQMFRLGYDMAADTLTIPIRSVRGDLLGVIRRLTQEAVDACLRPKYMHPTGFKMGRTLFGAHLVHKMTDSRKVALVEGPLDAVACWDAGVPAMAMHGARLSPDQAKIVRRLDVQTVVCMTDNDNAGDGAAHSIKEQLRGLVVQVGIYGDGWPKDPGELTRRQRREMFDTAVPYWDAWS